MPDQKYYIRKGNKAIGPLTLNRLTELLQQGTLQPDSIIGQSAKGPWLPLVDILRSENPISETPAPSLPSETTRSNADFSAMDLVPGQANIIAGSASTYWQQATVSQSKLKKTNHAKSVDQSQTPWYVRAFAPWVGENDRGRYGNLERYIEIYKSVNVICFVLGFIAVTGWLVFFEVVYSLAMLERFKSASDKQFPETAQILSIWMLQSFAILLVSLVGYLLLHLLYIISMAFIDFFRLMIDVEGNTRQAADYAKRQVSSL